ncbi:MAG: chemotaxis protein CheW [Actinobacteria bacterium]|nr:chemotaxis protein CheW [Actinomycetota bacterium]
MTEQQTQTISPRAQQLTGKYLSFSLAGQEYAVQALKVREIIGMQDITTVPCTPDYVKGVINLRGRVIPVLDLRLKMGLPEHEHTRSTAIIITGTEDTETGVLVDAVSDVLEVSGSDVEDPPSFGKGIDNSYILGLAKTDGQVTILLELDGMIAAVGLSTDRSLLQ